MSGKTVLYLTDRLLIEVDGIGCAWLTHDLSNEELPAVREKAISELTARLSSLAPGANTIGGLKSAIERLKELVTADEAKAALLKEKEEAQGIMRQALLTQLGEIAKGIFPYPLPVMEDGKIAPWWNGNLYSDGKSVKKENCSPIVVDSDNEVRKMAAEATAHCEWMLCQEIADGFTGAIRKEVISWASPDVAAHYHKEKDKAREAAKERSAAEEAKRQAEAKQKAADILANRDTWLRETGHPEYVDMANAGYDISGHCHRALLELVREKLSDLGLRIVEDDPDETSDRLSPSIKAWEALKQVKGIDPGATIVWGSWSEDNLKMEIIEMNIACPWDPDEKDYLVVYVIGEEFAT